MKSFLKIGSLGIFCVAFLFFAVPTVLAEDPPPGGGGTPPPCTGADCPPIDPPECVPSPTTTSGPQYDCNEFIVYKCANNACGKNGGGMQQGIKYSICHDETTTDGCGGSSTQTFIDDPGPLGPKNIGDFGKVGNFQQCPASNNTWSQTIPIPQCQGICYPAPELFDLDKIVKKPKNIFDGLKLKLPIHFEWKDNAEKELERDKNPDGSVCPVTYDYAAKKGSDTATQGITAPPIRDAIVSRNECTLKPGTSYEFQIKACEGGTCSQPGKQSFDTSNAPQLLTPYDQDWEDKESSNDAVPFPITLKWCEVPDSEYYTLNISNEGVQKTLNSTKPEFTDYLQEIQKLETPFSWNITSCDSSLLCSVISQTWSFLAGKDITLQPPTLKSPAFNGSSVPVVNYSSSLVWSSETNLVPAYLLHIEGPGLNKEFFVSAFEYPLNELGEIWTTLDLTYKWKVASCTAQDKKKCQQDSRKNIVWSSEWQFKTTGKTPTSLSVYDKDPGTQRVAVPFTINWGPVPSAFSYRYEIATNGGFAPLIREGQATNTHIQIPFSDSDNPQLTQNTTYHWRVKTCADDQARICGNWTSNSFTTVSLAAPLVVEPEENKSQTIPTVPLSWHKVFSGNFYTYKLTYTTPRADESPYCRGLAGTVVSQEGIVLNGTSSSAKVHCAGQYALEMQACLDDQCKEKGTSRSRVFSVVEPEGSTQGFVSCGAAKDNKSTPWDEKEPCQLKHIFLLLRNILDFILWKLSIIVVAVGAIGTGAFLYFFSFGNPLAMAQIKSAWKAVGVGYLIILFAWVGLNLFLDIAGFNVNVFGRWYDIPS